VACRAGYGDKNKKGLVEKRGRYSDDDVILEVHDHYSFLGRLGETLVAQKEAKDRTKTVEERRQAQGRSNRRQGVTLGPANRGRDIVEPRYPSHFARRHIKFCASQELAGKAEKAGGA
jgi:hypothetical protein